jgi:hypothetical protein
MESIKAQLATLEHQAMLSLAKGSASLWILGGTLAMALFGASAVNATSVHSSQSTPSHSTVVTPQHHYAYDEDGGGYGDDSGYGD